MKLHAARDAIRVGLFWVFCGGLSSLALWDAVAAEKRAAARTTARRALPADEELADAARRLQAERPARWKAARSPRQQAALARWLLQQPLSDDRLRTAALFREAERLGVAAGDVRLAWEACDRLGEWFAIDPLLRKSQALQHVLQSGSPVVRRQATALALPLLAQLTGRDTVKPALELLAAAKESATSDGESLPQLIAWEKRLLIQQQLAKEQREAEARLRKDPTDSQANWIVGRSLCLQQQDWKRGLEHLARVSSMPALQKLARSELQVGADVAAQLRQADGWVALSRDEPRCRDFESRALYWYFRAMPKLNGPQRSAVEASIAAVRQRQSARRAEPAAVSTAASSPRSAPNQPPQTTPPSSGIRCRLECVLRAHPGGAYCVRFVDSERLLSGGADRLVKLWQLADRQEIRRFVGHQKTVSAVDLSRDGRTIVSASHDQTIRWWNLRSGRAQLFRGHTGPVRDVCYAPDGRGMASVSDDRRVIFWQRRAARPRVVLVKRGILYAVAVSSRGAIATGGEDRQIRLYGNSRGAGTRQLSGHAGSVRALVFSPDGKVLISGGEDQTLLVWKLRENKRTALWGHQGAVTRLAIARRQPWLASASRDRTVKLWNYRTGKLLGTLNGFSDQVLAVSFSADDRLLAAGGKDGTLRVWRLPSAQMEP